MFGMRVVLAIVLLGVLPGAGGVACAQLRASESEPGVFEIGAPKLISHAVLEREMERNSGLREYIRLYGWPDYSEVQEIDIQEPFATYEVKLYYIRRNQELAFGRVFVSPTVQDYGVLKYKGRISPKTLARLLTARPGAEGTAPEKTSSGRGGASDPPATEVKG